MVFIYIKDLFKGEASPSPFSRALHCTPPRVLLPLSHFHARSTGGYCDAPYTLRELPTTTLVPDRSFLVLLALRVGHYFTGSRQHQEETFPAIDTSLLNGRIDRPNGDTKKFMSQRRPVITDNGKVLSLPVGSWCRSCGHPYEPAQSPKLPHRRWTRICLVETSIQSPVNAFSCLTKTETIKFST